MKSVLATLLVLAAFGEIVFAASIVWKDATLSTTVLNRLDPAGLLNGKMHLFVCRQYTDQRWISGHLDFVDNGRSECKVAVYGDEIRSSNFQILQSPIGTTSWVRLTGGLPSNAIQGGSHRDGTPGYVCRGQVGNQITLGISHKNGNPCYATLNGKEEKITSRIEILVENGYGVLYDQQNF